MRHFGIILFSLVTFSLAAQDAASDLKKVNDYVNKAPSLWLELEYKVFPTWQSQKPMEITPSTIRKRGAQDYYMKMSHLELLQSASYVVAVNIHAKNIQITSRNEGDVPSGKQPEVDFKAMMEACKKVSYTKVSEEKALYTLFSDMGYDKAVIAFHPGTFRPLYAEIYYLGQTTDSGTYDQTSRKKMLITYKKVDRHPVFSSDDFSYTRYFIVGKDKKYVPAGTYKGYTINGRLLN